MIYFIRHGQTERNNARQLQGRSDLPLNEVGIRQAQDAAAFLRERGIIFRYVFTSPLIRTVQTAEIIAPDLAPVVEERLIEMDYGPYEGLDLRRLPPEVLTFFRDFVHNPAPEGMEQLPAVVSRVGEFLEEIKDLSGNILISTHAIALKGALEHLTPESGGSWWSRNIGNCAVFAADNTGDHISVPVQIL